MPFLAVVTLYFLPTLAYTSVRRLVLLGEYSEYKTNFLFFFLRHPLDRCCRRIRERVNRGHRPGRPLHPRFSPPRVSSAGYRTSARQPSRVTESRETLDLEPHRIIGDFACPFHQLVHSMSRSFRASVGQLTLMCVTGRIFLLPGRIKRELLNRIPFVDICVIRSYRHDCDVRVCNVAISFNRIFQVFSGYYQTVISILSPCSGLETGQDMW